MIVSFIIPVLNGEASLSRCLRSIYGQQSPHSFEVIVVDNGSTDDSAKIAHEFPAILLHEPNRGRSNARNRGLNRASGTWVAFVDSDVELEPDWLNRMVEALADSGFTVAQGVVIAENSTHSRVQLYRKKLRMLTNPRGNTLDGHYFIHPVINTAACMVNRQRVIDLGGFDPELKTFEDIDLAWRLWTSGSAFRTVGSAVAKVYWTHSNFRFFLRFFEMGYGEKYFLSLWRVKEVSVIGRSEEMGKLFLAHPFYEVMRYCLKAVGWEIARSKMSRNPHINSPYSLQRQKPLNKVEIFQTDSTQYASRPSTRFLLTSDFLVVKNCRTMKKLMIPLSGAEHTYSLSKIISKHVKILEKEKFIF